MTPASARCTTWALAAALALAGAAFAATRREAESFRKKVDLIQAHALAAPKGERLTPITEGEVNGYLRYDARPHIPNGVVDPSINILGGGRLSGRAIVDLDAVRKQRSTGGWFDPWSYIGGQLPVTASGTLHTRAGVARFEFESATVSGLPVPKTVLEEVLAYYSRTPEDPDGIDLDEPFELPARIREIRIGRGQAVVVQ